MGAAPVQAGPTAEERGALLQQEEEIAIAREERQRALMEEQEEARLAIETAQRNLDQRAEEERIEELERLESEGADVAEYLAETPDYEGTLSDLYAALAAGTGFTGEGDTEEYPE